MPWVYLNWCSWVLSKYTFNMWNVSMYSISALAKPFYILSFRCHFIIKIPEHAPEIFRTSCSWRSILVWHYTSRTHVFRNPRQYLVEQNQCNAKQVLAWPAFSLWRQHNVNVRERHEAMLDHAKSIYSDYVISVFSYIIRFSFFWWIAYIIWMILHIARLCYWVKVYY